MGLGSPVPIDGRGILYDGYAVQEAGLKRRSTISDGQAPNESIQSFLHLRF